ncbi:MAG: transcriptional regulator [Candidatus Delongbacteria bacterium]|nr:transcriptional regulator [Candidatus Delongbacteria bacterium]
MQLESLIRIIEGNHLNHNVPIGNIEIPYVGAADLMSDILALTSKPMMLLTGLTAIQTIRTAEMSGNILAITFVRGKIPDENCLKLASEILLPIITTRLTMFQACGVLYAHHLKPIPLNL